MSYDGLTVEVYKFAASQLVKDLEFYLSEAELQIGNAVVREGLARRVIKYLCGARENGFAKDESIDRLCSKLAPLADRVSAYKPRDGKEEKDIMESHALTAHGENGGEGIPFSTVAIYGTAGVRLSSFIKERVADDTAHDWHNFCLSLRERVSGIFELSTRRYEESKRIIGIDSQNQIGYPIGRQNTSQQPPCGYCIAVYKQHNPKLRALLGEIDAALGGMKEHTPHQTQNL